MEQNFTLSQAKLKFLLTALKMIQLLKQPMKILKKYGPRERKKQDDELICHDHILNAPSDYLYDLYTNNTSAKEFLESTSKQIQSREGTQKFLNSKSFNFKTLDNILFLPQLNELQVVTKNFKAMKIELPESFQVWAIISKLPPIWKGYITKILHNSKDFYLEHI